MVQWSSKDPILHQSPSIGKTIVGFIDPAHVDDMSAEPGYQGPFTDEEAHVADTASRLPLQGVATCDKTHVVGKPPNQGYR